MDNIDKQLEKIIEESKKKSEEAINKIYQGRRLKSYRISSNFFDLIIKNKISNIPFVTEGLPEDAKLIQIYIDIQRFELVFIYEHDSFKLVKGRPIPEDTIIFKDLRYEHNRK